jgi:hypothetical protein
MTVACETILNDPAASDWLRRALASALDRDPVDAAADARLLFEVLEERCGAILFAGRAVQDINDELRGTDDGH